MFTETCIAAVILLGITISGVAQEKPDLSGEWILNRQASTLGPGADAVQSGVVRIEHSDPTFRYKAAFVSAGGPLQYEYELLSDGREIVSTQQGITTVSRLRWEENALVATWRIQRPDGEMPSLFGTNCSRPDAVFERWSNSGEAGATKTTCGCSSAVDRFESRITHMEVRSSFPLAATLVRQVGVVPPETGFVVSREMA